MSDAPLDALTPHHRDWLRPALASEEVAEQAIPTTAKHEFHDGKKAEVWLVLTTERVIATAALDDGRGWLEEWRRAGAAIAFDGGMLWDSIVIGDSSYALPRGSTAKGKALVGAVLGERSGEDSSAREESGELIAKGSSVRRLGALEQGEPPQAILDALGSLLRPREALLGAGEGDGAWLIVTTERAFVLRARDEAHEPSLVELDPERLVTKASSLGRDAYQPVPYTPLTLPPRCRRVVAGGGGRLQKNSTQLA